MTRRELEEVRFIELDLTLLEYLMIEAALEADLEGVTARKVIDLMGLHVNPEDLVTTQETLADKWQEVW